MLRLVKAFWDIALGRNSPANLPASQFLLGLVAAAAALLEICDALLSPPASLQGIFMRVALSVALGVGLPLAFAWIVLSLRRRGARFLQTGIALLGVGCLADVFMYPLDSLLAFVGVDRPAAFPLYFLLLVGLAWYLLACAHIWRAALSSSLGVGAAVSAGYLLLSLIIQQELLPNT
jgi:hypothetical protein